MNEKEWFRKRVKRELIAAVFRFLAALGAGLILIWFFKG